MTTPTPSKSIASQGRATSASLSDAASRQVTACARASSARADGLHRAEPRQHGASEVVHILIRGRDRDRAHAPRGEMEAIDQEADEDRLVRLKSVGRSKSGSREHLEDRRDAANARVEPRSIDPCADRGPEAIAHPLEIG